MVKSIVVIEPTYSTIEFTKTSSSIEINKTQTEMVVQSTTAPATIEVQKNIVELLCLSSVGPRGAKGEAVDDNVPKSLIYDSNGLLIEVIKNITDHYYYEYNIDGSLNRIIGPEKTKVFVYTDSSNQVLREIQIIDTI